MILCVMNKAASLLVNSMEARLGEVCGRVRHGAEAECAKGMVTR
jgi:hypothetical protein